MKKCLIGGYGIGHFEGVKIDQHFGGDSGDSNFGHGYRGGAQDFHHDK